MPPVRYAEDFKPGMVIELGTCSLGKDEIVEFASKYDPMPFHTDDQAARKSIFGGLIASGWHTALIMMRMLHGNFVSAETTLGSPGFDKLSWLKPVFPGDVLTGKIAINDVRISKSKPEMGFVNYTSTLTNQNGEVVYTTTGPMIFRTRAKAPA